MSRTYPDQRTWLPDDFSYQEPYEPLDYIIKENHVNSIAFPGTIRQFAAFMDNFQRALAAREKMMHIREMNPGKNRYMRRWGFWFGDDRERQATIFAWQIKNDLTAIDFVDGYAIRRESPNGPRLYEPFLYFSCIVEDAIENVFEIRERLKGLSIPLRKIL